MQIAYTMIDTDPKSFLPRKWQIDNEIGVAHSPETTSEHYDPKIQKGKPYKETVSSFKTRIPKSVGPNDQFIAIGKLHILHFLRDERKNYIILQLTLKKSTDALSHRYKSDNVVRLSDIKKVKAV